MGDLPARSATGFLVLTIVGWAAGSGAKAQQWLAADHLTAAREQLLRRDYTAATAELDRLLAERAGDSSVRYALVQALIESAALDRAFEVAAEGTRRPDADGLAWAALGDAQLVLGDFDDARRSYERGIQAGTPRARIGLGTLLESERELQAARVQFEKAYAVDPEDPQVLFGMARAAADLGAALGYVRRALGRDFSVEPAQRASIEGYATSREKLEGGGACEPVGERRAGEIKLRTIRPSAGEQDRLGMMVRINEQKPFVSLLDTGASGVIVTERLAAAAGARRLSDVSFEGLGEEGPRSGYLAWVERLQLGELAFRDCLVTVSAGEYLRSVLSGHESLMGLNRVYADFEVAVDFRRARMSLDPLPPVPRTGEGLRDDYAWERDTRKLARGYLPMRLFGTDLMVPTLVNGDVRAYFLLDSGSSTNFLSERLAGSIRTLRPSGVGVRGLSGEIEQVRAVSNVNLLFGAVRQPHDSVLALDFDGIAATTGFGIDGIIGYDTLRHAVVRIDARNALIRIDPAGR